MGLFHSPSIVTDGLVFALDAANTKSYPGTGSTVNDLSIVGNTSGSIVGSPSFLSSNLGVFDFSLGNNYLSYNCENQSTIFNGSNNFTMSLWFNPDAVAPSTGSSNAPLLFRIGTKLLFFTMGDGGAADELHLRVNQNSTWQTTVSSTSLDLQEWYCFVVTYNASSGYVSYTNGVQTETSSVTGTITSSSGTNSIGSVTNREYDGRIAAALLYDRDLSATEVAQNFEALRGRFGL